MKIYLLLTFSFLIYSCGQTNERHTASEIKQNLDTILTTKPKGYEPFTKENTTLSIISFTVPTTRVSIYEFPKRDSIYTIRCEMVGFKNREKTYPIKIVSDGLQIISRDSIQKTYTFKLTKDTAIVDCFIECQNRNVVYWQNDLGENKFSVINKVFKIGQADLVVKK